VGVDYFVWCVVEVFVFYGYVYYSYACSFYDGGAVADFGVDFNVWVFCFCFLHFVALLIIVYFWVALNLYYDGILAFEENATLLGVYPFLCID